MLKGLLPQGKLWGLIDDLVEALLLACADELVRIDERARALIDEADPRTTLELLPEYERELKLVAGDASIEERRARVVARRVRRQRFRPVDFQIALAKLLAQAPVDVVVIERTREFCIAIGDDREIFDFFILRDPSLPGAYFLESAQAEVDSMKPSHTRGTVIESVAALYDDPHSLYGRDLMGD
jgi:hypothetical protein